jgi:hypothetical protein
MFALCALGSGPAVADVTTKQSTTLDVAGIITMHGNTVEFTSGEKQRTDSEYSCNGLMSLFCRRANSGEIIRVDRGLTWNLNPSSKSYLETRFPTPEERALAQQKLEEALEKMKQCRPQVSGQTQTADTSKCELSAPKVDVKQSDEHATIAGHDSRKSSVTMTQTCTDKQTGDVCELVYGFDVWLTPDEIAGIGERRAFQQAHLKALGLDADNPEMRGAMQQFMAQYASTLKDLAGKAGSLKGYPLRTHFHVSMGGEHCGQAKQASARNPSSSSSNALGGTDDITAAAKEDVSRKVPDLGSNTANAVAGKLLGGVSGLFSKKASTPANTSATTAAPPAEAAAPYLTMLSLSIETTAVDTGSISPSQFEIPTGWLPEKPKAAANREFSCPAMDSKT